MSDCAGSESVFDFAYVDVGGCFDDGVDAEGGHLSPELAFCVCCFVEGDFVVDADADVVVERHAVGWSLQEAVHDCGFPDSHVSILWLGHGFSLRC